MDWTTPDCVVNWLWYQLSLFKANFVKLRMQFLALCDMSLLYYVKKSAFCVKIFINPVAVLWTVLILWLFEHNPFLPGSAYFFQQWSNKCLLQAVVKQLHNMNYSFIQHLTCCSKPVVFLLPCVKFLQPCSIVVAYRHYTL